MKVAFNNKTVLHRCIGKEQSFNLKLIKKTNIIVLATDRSNAGDTTFATITLTGGTVPYTINAQCRKNVNDTIFIEHRLRD